MADLPEGTVTFLFTDIEGSTRLLQELGDRYTNLLLDHRRTLREIFDRNRGVEFGTEGDSFFVAFQRATDAAAAAQQAQEALANGPVRVRMGIHTGEPAVVAGDYVGIDVHRAARICSAAHGGQVALSERTRGLLGDDVMLKDLGLHRLKDLTAPEKLFQLGLGDFPPLRSLTATNLPIQPAPLIGRRNEIADLTALATERRVVTLTGPGGTGKTRLALQVAAELVERFTDGTFWVPLAAVADPELVAPTIAGVLGAQVSLAQHIGEKKLLLLLDNLEQVLAAAPLLSELVAHCPNLHLLATTRAPLRIAGEREYAVEPLPEADAVTLFRERAVSSEPEAVVAEICRRLDRLPLAVELAAARTRIFSPTQLLERLGRRLPLLTGGRRDLPERQRTLRAAIDWSHDLLPPEAQQLFARLAVFPGSFDVEAAEGIADVHLDDLERLVEESLLQHREMRFWMFETIREYALERLAASGDERALRERHARYFLALAERAAQGMQSEAVGRWVRRRRREIDNLRAALTWTIQARVAEEALRLCIALTDVWEIEGEIEEGLRWFERAMQLPAGPDASLRARALRESGNLMNFANRRDESIARIEESVALWRSLGDPTGLGASLRSLASALGSADAAAARAALEEALEISTTTGDRKGERRALHLLGEIARDGGDFEEGESLLQRSIAIAREIGARMYVGASTHSLADLELDRSDLDRAEELYRASLVNAVECGLLRHKVYCLAGLAAVARRRGNDERAALFWGAVERAEETLDFRVLGIERDRYERELKDLPTSAEAPPELDEAVLLALKEDQG